jgi:hypothetical protein
MDSLKEYLISVGLKKYAPVGVMWAMAALGTYLAAHAGMLETWGITYGTWPLHWAQDPTGPCIVIELDTVSAAAITGVAGLVAIIIRATQHHVIPSQPPPSKA